jgi:hypothetical protein
METSPFSGNVSVRDSIPIFSLIRRTNSKTVNKIGKVHSSLEDPDFPNVFFASLEPCP